MKNSKKYYIFFLIFIIFLLISKSTSADNIDNEEDKKIIVLEFYYELGCDTCDSYKDDIEKIKNEYQDQIIVQYIPVGSGYPDNTKKFNSYKCNLNIPSVVIKNISKNDTYSCFKHKDSENPITYNNLVKSINYHLDGNYSKPEPEYEKDTKLDFLFGLIKIDTEEVSLPVLTILIGFFDSLNPCSFFILLFLLNLLIYAKSRKRMALIGGIFIFFSGFIYFLIMIMIYHTFDLIEQPLIITLIAGTVAVVFGIINIKDFFYFKQGFSLSVSDKKKKKLFSRMRDIINIKKLPTMIFGTIILAIFANTYELGCTLILPVVYLNTLRNIHMINPPGAYFYILFYNIMYVIPLIIIVSIFVITLGRRKLSEYQGRSLKLFSGTMIFTFGLIMISKPVLLKDLGWMIVIFTGSVISSIIISKIWKKYFEKPKKEKK